MRAAHGLELQSPRRPVVGGLLLIVVALVAVYCTVERQYAGEQIELNLEIADAAVALTQAQLELYGPVEVRGERVYAGDVLLNHSTELVDTIAAETGFGCTLFHRDVRISTTARAAGGQRRAVGTRASPEITEQVYAEGRVFRGITRTIGKDWVIVYIPWHDAHAERIGMIATFRELDDFHRDLWQFRGLLGGTLLALFTMLVVLLYRGHRRELVVLRQAHELAAAEAAAAQANASKSAFLAHMSHELRTPLNAILGYGELLHEELDERGDPLVEDVVHIEQASQHLLALINDILDLSKIEAGRMDREVRVFEISQVLSELEALVRPLAQAQANRLEVTWELSRPTMASDARMLRQILLNLLSNACKFTQHGLVRLRAELCEGPENPELVVEVTDTGRGISAEGLKVLFEPFVQEDVSTRREYGGTGLGLALSRELCQLLGGSIAVTSTLGQGTTFVVRVPDLQS